MGGLNCDKDRRKKLFSFLIEFKTFNEEIGFVDNWASLRVNVFWTGVKAGFSFQVRRAAAAEATEAEAAAPAAAHRVGREVAEIQVSLSKMPTSLDGWALLALKWIIGTV